MNKYRVFGVDFDSYDEACAYLMSNVSHKYWSDDTLNDLYKEFIRKIK